MPAAADTAAPAAAPAAAPVPLAGKVLQTMNAGGYSYIYIEQAAGTKVWVAVTQTAVKVGDRMSFKPGTEMRNPSKPKRTGKSACATCLNFVLSGS